MHFSSRIGQENQQTPFHFFSWQFKGGTQLTRVTLPHSPWSAVVKDILNTNPTTPSILLNKFRKKVFCIPQTHIHHQVTYTQALTRGQQHLHIVHTYVIHTCSIQCTTLVVVVLRIEWKKSGCSAAGFVVGKSREKKREPPHSNFYVFSTTINCFAFKPTHIVALIEGTPRHRKYVHFQAFPLFLFANESFTYLKY